jgi:YD repeat-containing protein
MLESTTRRDPVFPPRARVVGRWDLGEPGTTTFYGYDQDGLPVVETVDTGDETSTQFSGLHHVTIQGD